ncbi:hypothetical protein B0H21DRAFT_820725 [Amylocystis lapponica]|nr:hypothetical protein B0H21DRAFT_820725 [Amylocystis lapponica]
MALQPSLRPLVVAGTYDAPHTIDIFLDYVCPFSAKISLAIDSVLRPLLAPNGKYAGKVKLIFRPQVQPWHASSTFTHEAGLAVRPSISLPHTLTTPNQVARVAPDQFWPFSLALFKQQDDYFDIPARPAPRSRSQFIGADKLREFNALLELKGSPNGGVDVTDDLKYTIKFSRQNAIHVSPTVLWDGLVVNEASSSWGDKEWSDFLEKKVLV